MTFWTREHIIDALQRWTREHGSAPSARAWRGGVPGFPTYDTVLRKFGSFQNAREAAGVSFLRCNMEDATRADILAAIYRWRFLHNRLPREGEWPYPTEGWPGRATVRRLFGTWNGAIIAAGYEPQYRKPRSTASYRATMSAVTKAAA